MHFLYIDFYSNSLISYNQFNININYSSENRYIRNNINIEIQVHMIYFWLVVVSFDLKSRIMSALVQLDEETLRFWLHAYCSYVYVYSSYIHMQLPGSYYVCSISTDIHNTIDISHQLSSYIQFKYVFLGSIADLQQLHIAIWLISASAIIVQPAHQPDVVTQPIENTYDLAIHI